MTTYIEGTKILVPDTAPASQIQAVFFNSHTGVGGARNVWQTIDMSNEVPEEAIAIHVTGLLIITHGSNPETADLQLFFRKDSSMTTNYIHQVIETAPGGGQRCTMACWIPLNEDKTFQWKWTTGVYNGAWPAWSAYGANLQVDAVATN